MMKKMDILCAMRDAATAQALRRALDDGESCSVRVAVNGEAALDSAWRFVPDLLVVDAVLPRLDGLAVVDRLRAVKMEVAGSGKVIPVYFVVSSSSITAADLADADLDNYLL